MCIFFWCTSYFLKVFLKQFETLFLKYSKIWILKETSSTFLPHTFCPNRPRMCAQSHPTVVTPWTVACQAPLSLESSRQAYWTGLPFPTPWKYFFFFFKLSHKWFTPLFYFKISMMYCGIGSNIYIYLDILKKTLKRY